VGVAQSQPGKKCAALLQDTTVIVWDYTRVGSKRVLTLGQHTKSVTCVKWGGAGLLYTASQDMTVLVWRVDDGILCRTLKVRKALLLCQIKAYPLILPFPAGSCPLGQQSVPERGLCLAHWRLR
jgi:WD40 repeat protein